MLYFQRSPLSLSSLIQSPAHIALVHSSALPYLHSPSLKTQRVAVEAWLDQELVGLSLSEVYPLNHLAQIDSLVIKANYRHQGIGRQLFAFTEDLLVQQEQAGSLELFYEQTDPSSPILEKILISLGWAPGKMFLVRCHFNEKDFNPIWIRAPYPLSTSFTIFPWKELKADEKNTIEYLEQQGRFLSYLSPLRDESTIDVEISMGLRHEGKLVGWSITRRPDPSTVRYSSLYVDPTLLLKGYGIQLLIASIRRHKELRIPHALFEINVKDIEASWARFVKKRLFPIATKVERIKHAFRALASFLD